MRRCRFAQHRKRTAVMALCFGCTSMVHETRLAVPLAQLPHFSGTDAVFSITYDFFRHYNPSGAKS